MEIPSSLPAYHGKFNGQGMVTLSFDDGRKDFYRVSYPIMKERGLLGTFHLVTGWIEGRWTPPSTDGWLSTVGGPMTLEEVIECHKYGIEMSAHGDLHGNTRADIIDCVAKLKEWGLTRNGIVDGFASPGSGLTMENLPTMTQWFKEAGLTHARSGMAPGAINGKDVLNNMDYPPANDYRLTSIIVTDNTEMSELIPALMDAINNKRWCILMLHSVLHPGDPGYGTDNWWWDVNKFKQLCDWLVSVPDEKLLKVTMRDGFQYAKGNFPPVITSNQSRGLTNRRSVFGNVNIEGKVSNEILTTKINNVISK